MILRDYIPGEPLAEDEFLFKIRSNVWREVVSTPTGFLAKYTQKGAIPKAFESWGSTYRDEARLPIYVFREEFRSGWKIENWRFGQSQNWATMRHPIGFTVEIYLQQLLEIIQQNTVDAGVLIGEFKWRDNMLIKKQ